MTKTAAGMIIIKLHGNVNKLHVLNHMINGLSRNQ